MSIRSTVLTVSLAALIASSYTALAPLEESAAGAVTATKNPPIENPNWSGYSILPAQKDKTLNGASASWSAPRVRCESSGVQRTAVWVGMWGSDDSMGKGDAWLPQIGTDSQCKDGKNTYFIVYQLYHSNFGLCILVNNCKGTLPVEVDSPAIHPGDKIDSFVSYAGKTRSGKLKFMLDLTDNTTGKYFTKVVKVDAGTPLTDTARQGGVIVEDNTDKGGLAKFDPIKLWLAVYQGSIFKPSNFTQHEWVLKIGKQTLATNDGFKYSKAQDGYIFTVRWNHFS